MGTWQPISTAPKDGSAVLLFVPDEEQPIQVGAFRQGAYYYGRHHERNYHPGWRLQNQIGGQYLRAKPTHWMPLPEAPAMAVAA